MLLILVMVFSLAACGKSEESGSKDGSDLNKVTDEVTKAPETTKEPEITEAPETTKEPEVTEVPETTPEPTEEVEPKPTSDVEIEDPDNTGDAFYSDFESILVGPDDLYMYIFYGVYCENRENPDASFEYSYYGDEESLLTMDEFNAAFLSMITEYG